MFRLLVCAVSANAARARSTKTLPRSRECDTQHFHFHFRRVCALDHQIHHPRHPRTVRGTMLHVSNLHKLALGTALRHSAEHMYTTSDMLQTRELLPKPHGRADTHRETESRETDASSKCSSIAAAWGERTKYIQIKLDYLPSLSACVSFDSMIVVRPLPASCC